LTSRNENNGERVKEGRVETYLDLLHVGDSGTAKSELQLSVPFR
jgi:hypothetical protein